MAPSAEPAAAAELTTTYSLTVPESVLGVTFSFDPARGLTVLNLEPDAPARVAEVVQEGDILVQINDQRITPADGVSFEAAVSLVRQSSGGGGGGPSGDGNAAAPSTRQFVFERRPADSAEELEQDDDEEEYDEEDEPEENVTLATNVSMLTQTGVRVERALSQAEAFRPLHVELWDESAWYESRRFFGARAHALRLVRKRPDDGKAVFKSKAAKGEGDWEASIVRLDTRESDGALVPRVAPAKTTRGARGDKPVYYRTEEAAWRACHRAAKERDEVVLRNARRLRNKAAGTSTRLANASRSRSTHTHHRRAPDSPTVRCLGMIRYFPADTPRHEPFPTQEWSLRRRESVGRRRSRRTSECCWCPTRLKGWTTQCGWSSCWRP